jgi:hypothetical protein
VYGPIAFEASVAGSVKIQNTAPPATANAITRMTNFRNIAIVPA